MGSEHIAADDRVLFAPDVRVLARAPAAGGIALVPPMSELSNESQFKSRRDCLTPGRSSLGACSRSGSPLVNARGRQKIVMTMIA